MNDALAAFVGDRLRSANVSDEVYRAAELLAQRSNADAILFYGSVLRTGDLDALLDFYVLVPDESGLSWVSPYIWPDISFDELGTGGTILRAKTATMTFETFAQAASGHLRDTTIWTRFVQPAALVWTRGDAAQKKIVEAVCAAAMTATEIAAVVGPDKGPALSYWRALFRETYRAELRVERTARADHVVDHASGYYESLLPLAWTAAGISYRREGDTFIPDLPPARAGTVRRRWRRRRRLGKLLNSARLVKAAFMLDGAAQYSLYKVEKHSGISVPLTEWRRRHPILAAPGILYKVWRAKRR